MCKLQLKHWKKVRIRENQAIFKSLSVVVLEGMLTSISGYNEQEQVISSTSIFTVFYKQYYKLQFKSKL